MLRIWRNLDWGDIGLHGLGAIGMISAPLLWWPWGLVFMVWEAWLLREAAQSNGGDLKAALLSMPSWSLQKHLEWFTPGVVVVAAIATWQVWRW